MSMLPSVFSRKSSATERAAAAAAANGPFAEPADGLPGEPGSPLTRLVDRLSGVGTGHPTPEDGPTRRGFLAGMAVAGSALATKPFDYVLKPNTAYASVCGPGATCAEGWSVFCCTINAGQNSCPPGSFLAGWWKADNSSFCGGNARYYLDCNATCPTTCSCYCPTGTCDNRRTCCNQFRYGQCHQEIACAGPVVCRVISCTPPWQLDGACTSSSATDNRTALHTAPCLDSPPPPPPPRRSPEMDRVLLMASNTTKIYMADAGLGWRWHVTNPSSLDSAVYMVTSLGGRVINPPPGANTYQIGSHTVWVLSPTDLAQIPDTSQA
jgi:hypothetical protein